MKCRLYVASILLLTVGIASTAFAQRPWHIAKASIPPRIDGMLRDSVWQRATTFTDFKTLHPENGKPPSVRTEIRVVYDSSNIYVGIQCFDEDSLEMQIGAIDSDNIWDNDWVAFCLDSRDDGIGAFYFLVTSKGVMGAGVLNCDGTPTATRNLDWTSAAQRDPNGYTATVAVPLAQLPFSSADSVVMAFKVSRFIRVHGEEDDCPEILPEQAHVSQFRWIVLFGIVQSGARDDGFVSDLWNAYREKVAQGQRFDYNTFKGRVRGWHDASVLDYLVFPSRALHASREPFRFPEHVHDDSVASRLERLDYLHGKLIGNANNFLTETQTQSLIVIRNDTILYEKYFNGYHRDSVMTSFSVAKSFVSTLVGIAIDHGLIRSVADPITRYLPELAQRDPRFRQITVGDLLHMASGLRYVEDKPPYDNEITYLDPDLREAALDSTAILDFPSVHWLYCNYNPILIGMVLNRVTGKTITELLQTWLWNPLGMEFGGSWSIDGKADKFEKMESGINARAIDFAKLGALFLHHGRWRGTQIVSAAWVEQATQPQKDAPGFYGDNNFFKANGLYYGYFWWGSRRSHGESDFFALGNKGEYIYCSPKKNLVIVRTGMNFGIPSLAWMNLLRAFADEF